MVQKKITKNLGRGVVVGALLLAGLIVLLVEWFMIGESIIFRLEMSRESQKTTSQNQ